MASNGPSTQIGVDGNNVAINNSSLPALCKSASDFVSNDFDFVIIGGGTAGLVVAARLSENPDIKVGVLEAGKSRLGDPLVDVPTAFMQMLGEPEYDYGFKTVPQEGNRGIVHHISRGKALGGSSAINYMMYVRGSNADYDDWATLADDPSWSADALRPYVRKHQTLEPIDPSIADLTNYPHVGKHHGLEGPVRTSFNDSSFPIDDITIKALDSVCGYSKKPSDPWSGDHMGFFNTLGSVCRSGPNKGKRSYSARGYFEANASRPNLKVLCEAQVSKVVLENGTATGVEFMHAGKTETVKAKKEILVCGGVINSPQILELSGIGDPEVLKAAGVECKVELPGVGNNFQDHVVAFYGLELKPGNITLDVLGDAATMEQVAKLYAEEQRGPMTSIAGTQGFFSYKSQVSAEELEKTVQSIREKQNEPETSPFYKRQLDQVIAHLQNENSANLQLVMVPAGANLETGIQTQKIFYPPDNNRPHRMTLALCLQYPVARGSVHITSADPTTYPRVDPAYLGHEADVAVLAAAMNVAHKSTETPYLKPLIETRSYPAPNVDLDDAAQRAEAVREKAMGEYHPCGTCSMGEVLDSRLRVKGVKNLRVVDASVFPNHVSGNICSSVYTVAERGADFIKEDHGFAK